MDIKISEKGQHVVGLINKCFPKGQFTSKELSDACGEKVYAATLKSLTNAGFINDFGGSPKTYETSKDFNDLFTEMINGITRKGSTNKSLNAAKEAKDDEFYTRYEDIEAEVMKYKEYFKNKIVYLPCDDPLGKNEQLTSMSQFWDFFVTNFNNFGLKKLIATHFSETGDAYKIWIDKNGEEFMTDDDAKQESLNGNGDFASDECAEIMKNCDIIVTNPPFSIIKDFVEQIMFYEKDFLIISPLNAFKYKVIFPFVKNEKIWTGYNKVVKFHRPDGGIQEHHNVYWMTNLPTAKRAEPLHLTKEYHNNEHLYPMIDNYPGAIFIGRLADIPKDWYGPMGVPITYFDCHCPTQFEILEMMNCPECNGVKKYARIIIKRVK